MWISWKKSLNILKKNYKRRGFYLPIPSMETMRIGSIFYIKAWLITRIVVIQACSWKHLGKFACPLRESINNPAHLHEKEKGTEYSHETFQSKKRSYETLTVCQMKFGFLPNRNQELYYLSSVAFQSPHDNICFYARRKIINY